MVTIDSAVYATPQGNWNDIFSIDANHSDIVKFPNDSCQDYINIRTRIVSLVRDAHGNSKNIQPSNPETYNAYRQMERYGRI